MSCCSSGLSRTWCHTGAYFPFQMRVMDLHLCRMIDDRWLHVARFPTCLASDGHTGAYFPFWVRFTDLRGGHVLDDRWFHVGRFLTCHTFDAILGHITVLDEIHRSWTELSQVRGFLLHPFSGVHVRSFVRPHGVTLDLFGQIGYMRCHTGAYFPHLAGEAIVLSQILYSFHPSTGVYYICLTDRYSCDFCRGELSVEHDVRVWIAPLARTIQ